MLQTCMLAVDGLVHCEWHICNLSRMQGIFYGDKMGWNNAQQAISTDPLSKRCLLDEGQRHSTRLQSCWIVGTKFNVAELLHCHCYQDQA